jgi:hypothetical protein
VKSNYFPFADLTKRVANAGLRWKHAAQVKSSNLHFVVNAKRVASFPKGTAGHKKMITPQLAHVL